MLVIMKEAAAVRKAGIRSHYIFSSNAMWNWWELLFYVLFVRAITKTFAFSDHTQDIEETMGELHKAGLLEHTFVDLIEFKRDFRDCLQAISLMVFVSIFKVFKYLSLLNQQLNFMWRIILKAKSEIAAFMVIFSLVLVCMGYLATVLFGHEVRHFHNWCVVHSPTSYHPTYI